MKSILVTLFFSSSFSVLCAQQVQGRLIDAKKKPTQLLREVKKKKAYLIDVRTPEEFGAGHLKYAQNIDFKGADFKAQLAQLDKSKPVYLYCRSGNRSGKALDTLQALGFKTYYNIGGFEMLKVDGLPANTPEVRTH